MPHSSGGGHGGGGHGGGFHGGHGGSGSSAPRLYRSYRPGYHRYSYMLGGRTRYVYGDDSFLKRNPFSRCIGFWLSLIICLLMPGIMFGLDSEHSAHLSMKGTHDVKILDSASVFTDAEEAQLYSECEKFYAKSDISITVLTVKNNAWYFNGSLEQYAYNTYVTKFGTDETRWLIVYSTPDTPDGKWYWEGMQGDNTDDRLTEARANKFNKDFQKRLEKGEAPGTALAASISSLTGYIDKFVINWSNVFMYLFIGGICALIFMTSMGFGLPDALGKKLTDSPTYTCPYCYRSGYSNSVTRCPSCNRLLNGEEDDPLENDSSGNDEDDIFNPNVYGLMPDEDNNIRDWRANHN